jgi:hypothetical protein
MRRPVKHYKCFRCCRWYDPNKSVPAVRRVEYAGKAYEVSICFDCNILYGINSATCLFCRKPYPRTGRCLCNIEERRAAGRKAAFTRHERGYSDIHFGDWLIMGAAMIGDPELFSNK